MDPTLSELDGKFTDASKSKISSGTIFATIDLGIGPQQNKYTTTKDMVPTPTLTAIYLPEKYHPESDVNVLLYLHGHKRQDLVRGSIKDILGAAGYKFREQLAKTDKNFVLVAPTLGTKAQSGELTTSGAEAYLQVIMKALAMWGPHPATPAVGNIVVAAHSGAGLTMLAILQKASTDFRKKIKECWGLDCLYGTDNPVPAPQPPLYRTTDTNAKLDQRNKFLQAFAAWEKAQSKAIEKQLYDLTGFCKFFVYWTQQGGTQTRTKNLDLLAKRYYPFNSVEVSPPFYELDADGYVVAIDVKKQVLPATRHDDVPSTFMPGRVGSASSLS